jgi:isopentenyl phosphate kinase
MLVFLKLGGSLITVKDQPRALRAELLARLMVEIAAARRERPELSLVLGHGSGSFGHLEAAKHGTRQGVRSAAEWAGFAAVQAAAADLNHLVVAAANAAGLPVLNLPPSASAVCADGMIESMALEPLRAGLDHGLVPLVYGDVAFDQVRGGTIISTEDIFGYLAPRLPPGLILLAGIEPGVLTRWPDGEVVPRLAPGARLGEVGGSHGYDVTGGMASKVQQMLFLVSARPGLEVRIFSGQPAGAVRAALLGEAAYGTVISGQ